MKIWTCKVGETPDVPHGSDWPMRQAVAEAYEKITGFRPDFIFSGWGGELEECERAVVENRLPAEGETVRKLSELNEPTSCMNKAYDDEMTFVLLGRDVAAPIAIRAWIAARILYGKNQPGDAQLIEAEQCATAMEMEFGPAPGPPKGGSR